MPERPWNGATPRRALLLALGLLPLLTPVLSPGNDGPVIYPYLGAIILLSAWFCWKASLLYPLERVRWQTVMLAQCVHAIVYLFPLRQPHTWFSATLGGWLSDACLSVCWVLFFPALMGVRSVRGGWVRALDYLLAVVTSGLMTRAIGSGVDPGNGSARIVVIQMVITVVTVSALLARGTSTRPGIRLFSNVMSMYLGANLLVSFLLNIVNIFWLQRPHILSSDLLIAIPELLLCDLAASRRSPPATQEPELEPFLVDNFQPSILTITGVLLALYGLRTHALVAGAFVVLIVLCYALRTQLFYHRLFQREKHLRMEASRMQELATRDALTGVGNRRWFDEEATKLLGAERTYPCSLVIMDIDRFKEINDTLGHQAGDEALRAMASVLAEATAQVKRGCCARIGGDEFGALWPGTTRDEALELAETARAQLAERGFSNRCHVTVSIGVASTQEAMSLMDFLRCADAGLYRAKAAGRNQVRTMETAQ